LAPFVDLRVTRGNTDRSRQHERGNHGKEAFHVLPSWEMPAALIVIDRPSSAIGRPPGNSEQAHAVMSSIAVEERPQRGDEGVTGWRRSGRLRTSRRLEQTKKLATQAADARARAPPIPACHDFCWRET